MAALPEVTTITMPSPASAALPLPLARHVLSLSATTHGLPTRVKVTQWGASLTAAKHVVFYFGGMPASAEEPALHSAASQQADAYAARGLHLICIDKPGMGGTPFSYRFQIRRDWPVVVHQVAQQLNVPNTYGVMGMSNGGPYVMSTLTHPIFAKRVKAACMIVGVSDPVASGYFSWRNPSTLFEGICNSLPLAITAPFNAIALHLANLLLFRLGGFASVTGGRLPEQAKEPLRRLIQDGARNLGLGAALDCQQGLSPLFARQSSDLSADSVDRQASLAYNNIQVPVSMWYGTKDSTVPMASAEWLAQQIPNATLNKLDEGHMLYLVRPDDVLDDFVRVLDTADEKTSDTK